MTEVTYELLEVQKKEITKWKTLYEAAAAYIKESPCDPDIHPEQVAAYNKLTNLQKENNLPVS